MERSRSIATDNIYRNRGLRFTLDDGTVVLSTETNWHQVPARRVVGIELFIRQYKYRIAKCDLPDTFIEFIHFRSKGTKWVFSEARSMILPEEMNSWTIGWSDGTTEHLAEFDFQTGQPIRVYDEPISMKRTRRHPESLIAERGFR